MRELSRFVQSRAIPTELRDIAKADLEVILNENYKDWEYSYVLRTKIMISHDLKATVIIGDVAIDIEFSGDVRRGLSVRNDYVLLYGDCFKTEEKEIIERITDYLDAKSFFEI